jgi:hypothetical protein
MKTFTVAGTSKENGELKFRVANDLKGRIAMLERCDNTDIQLIELPTPMLKEAAAQYLLEQNLFPDAADLLQRVAGKEKAPAREPKAPKARAVKPAKTAVAPEADVVDDDGFVEPKDEKIQVAMSQLARQYPGMSAKHLYEQVMLTYKHFGDTEPNF